MAPVTIWCQVPYIPLSPQFLRGKGRTGLQPAVDGAHHMYELSMDAQKGFPTRVGGRQVETHRWYALVEQTIPNDGHIDEERADTTDRLSRGTGADRALFLMRKPGNKGPKSTWIIMRAVHFSRDVHFHHKLDQPVA